MAEVQHYVFHGYPVSVEQVGEHDWHVKVKNRDGHLVLDTTVSEKPLREQLETFFNRMFPRALPASQEAKDWAVQYAKEHPEDYAKIRAALRRSKVKEPIKTGFVTRPQPNPAPPSVADLTRQLKF